MIRHTTIDFEGDEVIELEDGGRMELKIITSEEFDGLGDAGYYRLSKGFQFKAHRHNCVVTATVLKGSVELKVPGQEDALIQPGDTFLLEPGQLHTETALEDDTVIFITGGEKDEESAEETYEMETVAV